MPGLKLQSFRLYKFLKKAWNPQIATPYGTLWLRGKCISGLAQKCPPLLRDQWERGCHSHCGIIVALDSSEP